MHAELFVMIHTGLCGLLSKVYLVHLKDIWLAALIWISPLGTIGAIWPLLLLPFAKGRWFPPEGKQLLLEGDSSLPLLRPAVPASKGAVLPWCWCSTGSFLPRVVPVNQFILWGQPSKYHKVLLSTDVLQMLVRYLEVKNHCEGIHFLFTWSLLYFFNG